MQVSAKKEGQKGHQSHLLTITYTHVHMCIHEHAQNTCTQRSQQNNNLVLELNSGNIIEDTGSKKLT